MARTILIYIICILLINFIHAQDNNQSTQQIVLDLKDPSTIIINPNNRKSSPKKFEIHSKSPVLFKIKNINPLRHDYYLNDEIVTNFFDATSIVQPNNIYVNGINPVKEIPAINIFTFDITSSVDLEQEYLIRSLLKECDLLRKEYRNINDSIITYYNRILQLPGYTKYYNNQNISSKNESTIKSELNKYDQLYFKALRIEKELSDKLHELLNIYNKLNDKDISILEIRSKNLLQNQNSEILNISKKCNEEFSRLQTQLKFIDQIIYLVQHINLPPSDSKTTFNSVKFQAKTNYLDTTKQNRIKLSQLLQSVNYLDNKNVSIMSDYLRTNFSSFDWTEEKYKIIEFVLNKKNKYLESFILFNSLEVGKLLESKWIEYARIKNEFLNRSGISEKEILYADSTRFIATQFFNYVKAWIADFALLNQSVKLDNKIFKEVHTNITVNCNKLLLFIRDLDHLVKPNITEYTFPIFHNNKNVDLIRFKIDKKDKFSNAQQTYVYDMWIKGGLKIDFSVGFLTTGLIDQQYNTLPFYTTSTDEAYKDTFLIARANTGRYNFCFGGMVNISRRNGASWLNIGGSLGLGYSTNQKLQALAGLSFHLGKTERIILHAGFSFGSIKHLDLSKISALQPGNIPMKEHSILVKGDINNYAIPEIERFSAKPFFGISYNLSRQNSFQAVKSQPGLQYYNSERQ